MWLFHNKMNFRLKALSFFTLSIVSGFVFSFNVKASSVIQFNTDVLDVVDRENIDLSQFSHGNYIMPGTYTMTVHVNQNEISDRVINFYPSDDEASDSLACISPELVKQLALKSGVMKEITWWHENECLNIESIKGMEARVELANYGIYLSIPQAYLEYDSPNWDPPSRWDEGILGVLFDYNLNLRARHSVDKSNNQYNLSGNGVAGTNLGAWRFRADWQSNWNRESGKNKVSEHEFKWTRYYAYRALPLLKASLTLGEDYLRSNIFDSFRFIGLSLVTDDNMLPPNLRGYAPEVTGVAKTNAKIVISQKGRIIYETLVAAGPFRIQDLSEAVSGELDVRVEEQDGSVQEFKINTASIPYLTRPGSIRYKIASGRPQNFIHKMTGPMFGMGEFSWGISNGWSLYGGAILSQKYNAQSLGVGRDLFVLGALSFDITQSQAKLRASNESLTGRSYRLSYSKTFDEIDSQVTFAGYRFSEKNFMNMSEYLDSYNRKGYRTGNNKEMYTISFNKNFRELNTSLYLNYDHQTYWNKPSNNRYSLVVSRYFDIGRFRNISLSLSAYRNEYDRVHDNGAYLSMSMPWGSNSSINYSLSTNRSDTTHRAGYYERIDDKNDYQVNVGHSRNGANFSGYYNYQGNIAKVSSNVGYQESQYSAAGVSAQGGVTLSSEGGALHRVNVSGGARLLVDTDGVSGVPIRGTGSIVKTNYFGKAVLADMSSYYRSNASIDLNELGNDVDATKSVVQATLTEGAIGYRKFGIIAGRKAMATVRLIDGASPPFGAVMLNERQQETGIVGDEGLVYLSGIKPNEVMTINWDNKAHCSVDFPEILPDSIIEKQLLLICK